jgi:hypothetical protein
MKPNGRTNMPPVSQKPTKKASGAQPGNKNAQKHGFYSDIYTVEEAKRFRQVSNIEDEQKLLRTTAFRIAKHLHFDTLNPEELNGMYYLILAIQHINTIERTIMLARGKGGEIGKTILEALKEMNPDEDLG